MGRRFWDFLGASVWLTWRKSTTLLFVLRVGCRVFTEDVWSTSSSNDDDDNDDDDDEWWTRLLESSLLMSKSNIDIRCFVRCKAREDDLILPPSAFGTAERRVDTLLDVLGESEDAYMLSWGRLGCTCSESLRNRLYAWDEIRSISDVLMLCCIQASSIASETDGGDESDDSESEASHNCCCAV